MSNFWRKFKEDTATVPGNEPGPSNARIKIALVAPSLKYVGGQAVQANLFLRYWQNDPEVEARFIAIDPAMPPGLGWVGSIPVLRTLVREPLYLLELWRNLRHVDIAHIFSASYWSFLLAPAPALILAQLREKKTLINYRSGEARDHLRRFRSAHRILARADRLIVPSGYLVNVFQEFNLQAQAVPNVVDLSQFSFRIRDPIRPHLVCTRGFHPYYCVDVVVRAFAEVKQAYPEARLDLVGGGPLENEVRTLVTQLNLKDVTFSGVASREDIGRFYDRADIFINGSYLDNMPVSILEAFASGIPVASTAPEGIRYLIEHERTGLLSAPGDEHSLAQNVIRLLKEPELAVRIITNAHEQSKGYRWAEVREQWLGIYRSLVRQTREAAQGVTSAA